jgi:hypothetical protein
MRQTPSLGSISVPLIRPVFAGSRPSRRGEGSSRRYPCDSFPGCLDPCPGGIPSASARFFLGIIGLPLVLMGRLPTATRSATSERKEFSRLQSFRYVQASRFAGHPGRAYRSALTPGSCGVYIRAERGLLPSHASDMLPVRTGQLTGKNFHLQESQSCRPLRGPVPLRPSLSAGLPLS